MLKKRLIPCLDVKAGKVVKGTQFKQLSTVGDPVAMAAFYADQGADELVFYDITASTESRNIDIQWVAAVAEAINIPFTVGGGIRTLEDFYAVLAAGADKVSINSIAYDSPELITLAAERFGCQCVVLSIDVKRESDGSWQLYKNGGTLPTGLEPIAYLQDRIPRGVGEIVINAIHEDGMGNGYDLELIQKIAEAVAVPIIASGGAGSAESISQVLQNNLADAALIASALHSGQLTLPSIKAYLDQKGIPVRRGILSLLDSEPKDRLLPVIIQEASNNVVRMLGYMNQEAYWKTLLTQRVCFYSRSRQRLWTKGETSGNTLTPVSYHIDCDSDTLLILVKANGPTCHTGAISCFDPLPAQTQSTDALDDLYQVIHARKLAPKNEPSYTQYLFEQGLDKILKKVGEEASEVIIASKNCNNCPTQKQPLQFVTEEVADLIYHLWVLLAELNLTPSDVWKVLERRARH